MSKHFVITGHNGVIELNGEDVSIPWTSGPTSAPQKLPEPPNLQRSIEVSFTVNPEALAALESALRETVEAVNLQMTHAMVQAGEVLRRAAFTAPPPVAVYWHVPIMSAPRISPALDIWAPSAADLHATGREIIEQFVDGLHYLPDPLPARIPLSRVNPSHFYIPRKYRTRMISTQRNKRG